jgi:hypothetical protein
MRSQVRFKVAQGQQDTAPHAMMSELSFGNQASQRDERDTQRLRCRRYAEEFERHVVAVS